MKSSKILLILGLSCFILSSCSLKKDYYIVISPNASLSEVLASREIRRYIYLRTDKLLPVIQADSFSLTGNSIIIAVNNQEQLKKCNDISDSVYKNLKEQEFILKSVSEGRWTRHFIIGGGPEGVLFGAYQFVEKMGIRFYLHGDVIPDKKQKLDFPPVDEYGKPLFEVRGILPFHDFPEGPDWWNLEEYKAIIGQLPKLKMNFIGFHTYPEVRSYPSGYCQAEPLVWIGPENNIRDGGYVTSAYPVLHFNTRDDTWGYRPMKTSDYHCGAAQLFEQDYYGASYMMNVSGWPHSEEENIGIFNEMGTLLNNAFSFARLLNVKTCLGTETPLTIPLNLTNNLKAYNIISGNNLVKEIYKGLFSRIIKAHPLDYYWLWTPENWTWSGASLEEVRKTEKDLLAAVSAAEEIRIPFTLATCGWVLGPPEDPTRFDKLLPENMPFSCINREVGFSPVEPSFANLTHRPKWAIPWMEDDPALISPQLWAGRMRKDAADAMRYGCNGLMGIHWRTRILGPNVSALAASAWKYEERIGGKKELREEDIKMNREMINEKESIIEKDRDADKDKRDLPVDDFYKDWALCQFGSEVSDRIAGIFVSLDGGPMYNKEHHMMRPAKLYRIADWQGGPGGILINRMPWDTVQKNFAFIPELENLRQEVTGKGNMERFDYWLNTFRYARSVAHFGCIMGVTDSLIRIILKNPDFLIQKEMIEQTVLPLRIQAARIWEEIMNYLMQTVATTGELGTITNLEQHNLGLLGILNKYDSLIVKTTGQPLPPEADLSLQYNGPVRIIVPAVRSLLETGEDFNLKVILLSGEPVKEISFYWKNLGDKQFNKIPLIHINRGVYKVMLFSEMIKDKDFEYYIEATSASLGKIYFPAAAPEINQTIVVLSPVIE